MTPAVIVDAAEGQTGGVAWYWAELLGHLARTRRVALNNIGFVTPGAQRWTLQRNALDFLAKGEEERLDPARRAKARREAAVVHLAARRSDVIVAPCTAMAERIATVRPDLSSWVIVRLHPVSVARRPTEPDNPVILCSVLFASYKEMPRRLAELLAAVDDLADPSIRVQITAHAAELPAAVAGHAQVELVGRLAYGELQKLRQHSRAIYFPTGLESFGYPLAEARASGQPVIARDTDQNREVAGPALSGYTQGDPDSLRSAVKAALAAQVAPDPGPFDPDRYFDWLLGLLR
jgi:hypothetical protein